MKKKKILYSVVALLLIAGIVFVYMQMSGNKAGKYKAKESLEEFLEQTYPEMDYKIKRSVGYGWTDETYEFHVVVENSGVAETNYRFLVSGIEPYEVFSDSIHTSKIDKAASKKLNAEAERYILTLLQKKIPQIDAVDTDVEVYSKATEEWTPKLKTPKPIHIMLEIEKGERTKEQMVEQCKMIQKLLNDESINYETTDVEFKSMVNGEENLDYVLITPGKELKISDVK